MIVKWLLQSGIFDENLDKMCKIIKEQGSEYQIIDRNVFEFNQFKDDACVVFYGSIEMMQRIQRIQRKKKKWIPGWWCNFKNFECTNYYPVYGDYLLNKDYIMLPVYAAIKQKDFIIKIFNSDKLFIRSDSGAKEIEGQIIDIKNLDLELFKFQYFFDFDFQYHNNLSLLTIISSVKEIEKEWRLVVSDKKVITGSQYKINGELEISKDCPQEVIDFGNELAKSKWQPDIIYTMDICESSGQLYLLEINSFSCSGLYDCNLEAVIKEANRLAIQEYEEYQKTEEVEWPKGYKEDNIGRITKITE